MLLKQSVSVADELRQEIWKINEEIAYWQFVVTWNTVMLLKESGLLDEEMMTQVG